MAAASTKRYAEGKPLSFMDGIPVAVKEAYDVVSFSISVVFYIYSFELKSVQSSGKKKLGMRLILDSQELFERKLVTVIYVMLHYSRKRFFRKGFDPELI